MQQYEEDEEGPMPFESAERTSTLQRCRVFNDVPLNVKACTTALTEILYLIYRGLVLTTEEATALFFQSTKLLQSTNPRLRRLHYVLMKELSPLVEQSFIASNSLMGDTKSENDSTKSNALRTLYAIMDKSMYQSMERTIMESMNSRNPNVVTAAFVTGLHIAQTNTDMPKKWLTQLTEVVKEHSKAQYPAIALLHQLRHNDRLSFARLMDQANYMIRYPLALCLTVRMGSEVMREDMAGAQNIYQFMVRMMQNAENELVMFEAAKALCSMRETMPAPLLEPVAKVLAQNLTWSESVGRFAALHMLHQLALIHPRLVEPFNSDIMALVDHTDHVLQTLAIVTLLKTGDESVLEQLTTQFSSDTFLLNLNDRSKMIIVDAIHEMNIQQSGGYAILLTFLYRVLTTDGSCELKENVITTMIRIARRNGEARDTVLTNLAEFVDDCEFPSIMTRVLTYIGDEVPYCSQPQKLVRYVYNHATLEQAEIRVVAIRTLAKIAARVPSLRRSIRRLLRLSCADADDEVRDRAVLYASLFAQSDAAMVRTLMDDASAAVRKGDEQEESHHSPHHRLDGAAGRTNPLPSSEAKAQAHKPYSGGGGDAVHASGTAAHAATFTSPAVSAHVAADVGHARSTDKGAAAEALHYTRAVMAGRTAMQRIRPLRELGRVRHSTEPVLLTESDNEYVVSVMKHVVGSMNADGDVHAKDHAAVHAAAWSGDDDGDDDTNAAAAGAGASYVVLQFRVHNTMDGVAFRHAHVRVDVDGLDGAEARFAIPAARVPPNATRYCYVVLTCDASAAPDVLFPTGVVESTFCFATVEEMQGYGAAAAATNHRTRDNEEEEEEDEASAEDNADDALDEDGAEASSEEEFALEAFELVVSDYISPVDLGAALLRRRWSEMADRQTAGTYALRSMRDLTTAAHEVAQFFGMHVEGGVPEVVERPPHMLFMSGTLADAAQTLILIQAKLFITADDSVALGLSVRGGDETMRDYLANMLLA